MSNILQEIVEIICTYKKILFIGLTNTFLIWFFSIIVSVGLAFFWGALRDHRFFPSWVTTIFDYLAYLVQGIPFYIQALCIVFYIAPQLCIENTFIVGIFALGFCSAAYGSQIIKTAYQAVPKNQFQLAMGLGYAKRDILLRIILPQAIPHIIPLYISESDQLLKSTTILSTVGIFDFTKSCMNIISIHFNMVPVYFILVFVYLTISLLLRYIAHYYRLKLLSNQYIKEQ